MTCPSEDVLRSIGSVGDETFRGLESHIEACPDCQAALERIARERPRIAGTPGARTWPRIDGFEILSELGRGAMGVVYLARQERLGRLVALKILPAPAGTGPEDPARRRWLREAKAVSLIRHPGVVTLLGHGECDGWLYLILEYVPGGPLGRRLGSPLPPRTAAKLVEQVARAVEHIHKNRMRHLDLKPSNILVDLEEGAPLEEAVPRVTDFGLAVIDDSLNLSEASLAAVRGTPAYMAPEQAFARVDQLGPETDVYALGVILYELLCGRVPFRGKTPIETLDLVRNSGPTPPRSIVRGIPRDLATITLKCLEKEPGRRYATAEAVAEDLRRWQDGHAIRVRPASPAGLVIRWARRNPAVASLTTGLLVFTAAGVTLLSSLAYRVKENQKAFADTFQIASGAVSDAVDLGSRIRQTRTDATHDPVLTGFENTRALTEKLYALNHGDISVRDRLIQVDRSLSSRLVEHGQHARAEEVLRHAKSILDSEQARGKADESLLAQSGGVDRDLALILSATGRLEEAASLYERAIPKLSPAKDGSLPLYVCDLFRGMVELAETLVKLDRLPEERAWLDRAERLFSHLDRSQKALIANVASRMFRMRGDEARTLDVLRDAVRSTPSNPWYALDLARGLVRAAELLPKGEHRSVLFLEAQGTLDPFVDILDAEALRDPANAFAVGTVAECHSTIGRALIGLDRPEAALENTRRLVAVLRLLPDAWAQSESIFLAVLPPLYQLAEAKGILETARGREITTEILEKRVRFALSELHLPPEMSALVGWVTIQAETLEQMNFRRQGRFDLSLPSGRALVSFADRLVADHPNHAFAHLALAVAQTQIFKNVCRGETPPLDEAVTALQKALAAAERAHQLDPRNSTARRELDTQQRRLSRFLAEHSVASRDGANPLPNPPHPY